MADTLTPNYGWTKPDPGGDANTWGTTLNATTDKIDAQVYANAQAAAAASVVGEIKMFGGATPPANWLSCNGASLSTTTYAKLFAVIGYAFGGSGANFNLPNLQGKFPIGVGGGYALAQTGGEATHVLAVGEMPAHNHGINDPTHSHAIGAYEHTHGVNDPSHSHGASQDSHNHSVSVTGQAGYGVGPQAPPSPMTNQGSSSYTTSTAQPAVHINGAGTGISIAAATSGIPQTNGNVTGITTQNAGGGGAHNNIPPFLAVNFIIRYQ